MVAAPPLATVSFGPRVSAQLEALYAAMRITAPERFESVMRQVRNGRNYYERLVERVGGRIPWQVVAAVHALEGNCNFETHLHNGDPLSRRTTHVPAGRPKAKPADGKRYSWIESAQDAVEMKGWHRIEDWSLGRMLWELERYNGFGYRLHHGMPSPYLWAGTNHYTRGKYVADGKWSSTAVSRQAGAAGILFLSDVC